MRVITAINQKGGVSKTTTVVALATSFAEAGHKVLLVDVDPQASAHWWCGHVEAQGGEPPFDVVAETDPGVLGQLRNVGGYDTVFVDSPGSLSSEEVLKVVISNSDYLIIPSPPAAFDVVSAFKTINSLVKPSGKPHKVLLTRVDSRAIDLDVSSAREEFQSQGVPVFTSIIRALKAHPNSQTEGRLLTSPFPDRSTRNAWEDYNALTKELLAEFARV